MERETMSQAEWQVMRVLWASPGATSAQVIASLSQAYDWQGVTIKTLLGRLKNKALVAAEKSGKKFQYFPLVSEDEQLRQSLESLQASVCNTKQVDLVRLLIETGQFSQTDLEQISQLALEKRDQAPERLICNCIPGQCTCGQHGGHHHG
ncbi:CopY/TcrY family copper transport repressor [Streptococcus merionis]|uniref:Putative transcriptional regulator n=1 Tax=Streptococcus merionis TaxID=400065 RepID=A0A239SZZ7_9STRE|nr:CopY/TcrY family copper transport repressor [Streptococcus merionis]SNU90153.1 putative transcriptional regulator [Streptococcus merionis]